MSSLIHTSRPLQTKQKSLWYPHTAGQLRALRGVRPQQIHTHPYTQTIDLGHDPPNGASLTSANYMYPVEDERKNKKAGDESEPEIYEIEKGYEPDPDERGLDLQALSDKWGIPLSRDIDSGRTYARRAKKRRMSSA